MCGLHGLRHVVSRSLILTIADSVAGTKVGSTEGKSSTDRYASVALRYLNNRFEAVFVADTTNWGSLETHKGYNDSENVDDGYTYTLGGNYTFDCGLKVMAFGQYFENQFIETPQGNI